MLAKAVNEYHARVLDKIGADMVVHPERIWAFELLTNLFHAIF